MKAQFGKQNLINVITDKQIGLNVVVAEGYRVVSVADDRASERLSPDCRLSGRSLRTRHEMQMRLAESLDALWRGSPQRPVTTVAPGAATITAKPAGDSRLPAPAWAAFVLNHALCG
jgi:hypothetical protein